MHIRRQDLEAQLADLARQARTATGDSLEIIRDAYQAAKNRLARLGDAT